MNCVDLCAEGGEEVSEREISEKAMIYIYIYTHTEGRISIAWFVLLYIAIQFSDRSLATFSSVPGFL